MKQKMNKRIKRCIVTMLSYTAFIAFFIAVQPFHNHVGKIIVGITLVMVFVTISVIGEMILLKMELTKEDEEKIKKVEKWHRILMMCGYGLAFYAIQLMFVLKHYGGQR